MRAFYLNSQSNEICIWIFHGIKNEHLDNFNICKISKKIIFKCFYEINSNRNCYCLIILYNKYNLYVDKTNNKLNKFENETKIYASSEWRNML